MPVINIPEPNDLLASAQSMAVLVAYCVYPDDEEKRSDFIKFINIKLSHVLGKIALKRDIIDGDFIDKNSPEELAEFSRYFPKFAIKEDSNLNEIRDRLLDYLANPNLELPEDIVDFLSKLVLKANFMEDIKNSLRPLATVIFLVFNLMRQQGASSLLREGISLENAIRFLLTNTHHAQVLSNRKDILLAWKRYRSIAPIAVGLLLAFISFDKVEIPGLKKSKLLKISPAGVVMAMLFAKFTQDWLLSIKPSKYNSARPIISKENLWTLPQWVEQAGFRPINLMRPFSDDEIKSMKRAIKKPRQRRKLQKPV